MKFCAIVIVSFSPYPHPGRASTPRKNILPPSEFLRVSVREGGCRITDSLLSVPYVSHGVSTLRWYSMFTNIPDDWVGTGESAFRPEGFP